MAKLTPFFVDNIKKLCAEALLEINSRLGQLEKDNEYLRRAVQKTQSEVAFFAEHFSKLQTSVINTNNSQLNINNKILKFFSKQPPAITAAPLKAKRKRKPKRGGGHARR